MGLAMEVIGGSTTGAIAAFTAVTNWPGTTLAIRNANIDSRIWLLSMWADFQGAAAITRVRSPRLHDNVQGIRYRVPASETWLLNPYRWRQPLIAQDVLILEQQSAPRPATSSRGPRVLRAPRIEGRFISAADSYSRGVDVVTVEVTNTPTAGGVFSGEVAFNSTTDLLKANTDYAVLGYVVDAECAVVRLRGADTGTLGIGGPGANLEKVDTRSYFLKLARNYDMTMVPVINSANKAGILCDIAGREPGRRHRQLILASWPRAVAVP
jgi:hypothetical protein